MSCAGCSNPTPMTGVQRVYIWGPQSHTRVRIEESFEKARELLEIKRDGECLVLRTTEPSKAIVRLSGVLTGQEASDTKVLLMEDREPNLSDFAAVGSLQQISDRIRSEWVVQLLDDKRYLMHLQPIVAAATKERFGFEYLLRGQDEEGHSIPASAIFDAVSEPRLLFSVDRSARLKAVETAAESGVGGHIFINFTPGAIYDPQVCLKSTDVAVKKMGLRPENIVFEVVESHEVEDLHHLRGVINFYRQAGYKVALDDFGSGYNSFETYFALKPDFIKIDKSITDRVSEPHAQSLISGLVDNCRQLGVKTIAEGVETHVQSATCVSLGVDLLQGYLFGKPAPASHWRDGEQVKAAE